MSDGIKVVVQLNESGNPPGKVADAELHFSAGILAGLKLIGFSVWERRGATGGYNVTFPARQYSVNGERRSFALLRPVADVLAQAGIRDAIIEAYRDITDPARASREQAGAERKATRREQVDQLLADGWTIARVDDDGAAHFTRGEGGRLTLPPVDQVSA